MKKIYYLLGLILLLVACNKNEKPVVLTGDPTNIEAYNVDLEGTLVDDYHSDILEVGFILGMNKKDVENQTQGAITKEIGTLKGSSITATIGNLKPGVMYYYCAFATNKNDLGRGEVKKFVTKCDKPTITLNDFDVTNINVTSLKVSGKVEDFGGSEIVEWGIICQSGDNKIVVTGNQLDIDNSFKAELKGLKANTTYTIYSYAKNYAGYEGESEPKEAKTLSFLDLFMNDFVNANGISIQKYELIQGVQYEVENGIESSDEGFQPVSNLSYNQINSFINKLNQKTGKSFRLPTVTEWQNAAAANEGFVYSGSDNIDEVAWYEGNNTNNSPHMVGLKKANGFGLFDMSGNVWEMTSTKGVDGVSHIICGGCYNSPSDQCLIKSTWTYPDGSSSEQVGFRLVKE